MRSNWFQQLVNLKTEVSINQRKIDTLKSDKLEEQYKVICDKYMPTYMNKIKDQSKLGMPNILLFFPHKAIREELKSAGFTVRQLNGAFWEIGWKD